MSPGDFFYLEPYWQEPRPGPGPASVEKEAQVPVCPGLTLSPGIRIQFFGSCRLPAGVGRLCLRRLDPRFGCLLAMARLLVWVTGW